MWSSGIAKVTSSLEHIDNMPNNKGKVTKLRQSKEVLLSVELNRLMIIRKFNHRRRELKLSKVELAKKLGVTYASVEYVLRERTGARHSITLSTICVYAEALELKVAVNIFNY